MILYYPYLFLLYLFLPIFLIRLFIRQPFYPNQKNRLKERLGLFKTPHLKFPIWIHAVSYGEAILAEQLVKKILSEYPKQAFVITTTTFTGAERIQKTFNHSLLHIYLPYDLPSFVRRFIQKIQPCLLIILERELWPTLIKETRQANIPIILANARLTQKSAQRYQRIAPLTRWMLNQITQVLTQTKSDASLFFQLGLDPKKCLVSGSIKYDMAIPSSIVNQGKQFKKILGEKRFILVAGSTHEGEEIKILEAFKQLKVAYPKALLVLAPRHPERFNTVKKLCQQFCLENNYHLMQRSSMHLSTQPTNTKIDLLLGDRLGELLIFYAASDVAFVGGSWVPIGGHNVLESIALGVPTFIGPYFYNTLEIVEHLKEAQAIQITESPKNLVKQIIQLQQDPQKKAAQIQKGKQALKANQGALERHFEVVKNFIKK